MPPGRIAIVAGVAPAGVLVALALWEAGATWRDAAGAPDEAAWKQAAATVRAGFRPGDLIEISPSWADPLGREVLGDLIPLRDAARMDDAKYARIWDVAVAGSHVDAHLVEKPPVKVLADVRDLVTGAKITGGGAHRDLQEVGFAPHDCILATPSPGQPIRVEFTAMPLGTKLVGYVGLADVFTRRDIREPGHLSVQVRGQEVATVAPGVEDGWVRFEATTTPGIADVVFTATAGAPSRLLCFAAEARE